MPRSPRFRRNWKTPRSVWQKKPASRTMLQPYPAGFAKAFRENLVYEKEVSMRRARVVCLFTSSLLFNGTVLYCQLPAAPDKTQTAPQQLTREQTEHFLLTARVVSERAADVGITKTKRITLSDGQLTHDAHVQTIDIYKPVFRPAVGKVERNFRDSYKFNIAAYQLAKLMDLDMVPVCVYRVIDDKPAAVDWWVD